MKFKADPTIIGTIVNLSSGRTVVIKPLETARWCEVEINFTDNTEALTLLNERNFIFDLGHDVLTSEIDFDVI